jgi:hypothetical protein
MKLPHVRLSSKIYTQFTRTAGKPQFRIQDATCDDIVWPTALEVTPKGSLGDEETPPKPEEKALKREAD